MSELKINDVSRALFEALQQHVSRSEASEYKSVDTIIASWNAMRTANLTPTSAPYTYQLLGACLYSSGVSNSIISRASLNSLIAIADEATNSWYRIVNVPVPNQNLVADIKYCPL